METTVVDKVIIDLTHVGDEIKVTQRQIPFQQGDIVRLRPDVVGYYFIDGGKPSIDLSSKRNYTVVREEYNKILILVKKPIYCWISKDSVLTHKTQLNIRYED